MEIKLTAEEVKQAVEDFALALMEYVDSWEVESVEINYADEASIKLRKKEKPCCKF